jgi:hypothetical protein
MGTMVNKTGLHNTTSSGNLMIRNRVILEIRIQLHREIAMRVFGPTAP